MRHTCLGSVVSFSRAGSVDVFVCAIVIEVRRLGYYIYWALSSENATSRLAKWETKVANPELQRWR